MKDNFFYSKTINGNIHLKMVNIESESLEKEGYSKITMEEYNKLFDKVTNKPIIEK